MEKLKLRKYQEEPAQYALDNDKVVLALAPNAGKSEIAVYVMGEYLKKNPSHRILFIPHSTNVLKANIVERLNRYKLSYSFSTDLSDDAQVHVEIPQNEKNIKRKYDFLIVDEAHQNYHADQVPRIIKKIKPSKQLLLTGTPEKFILKGGYDIYPLAANEISEEYFAKLNIELVTSNYNWKEYYNNDNNVANKFKLLKADTEKSLEKTVAKLLKRFEKNFKPDEYNAIKALPKLKSWFKLSKRIGKTLITCFRTAQADQIYSILKKQGVNVGISHSKSDDDNSEEIEKFKRGEYDIMVVVNRGKLGYSDENLMNIIDISGTHNPSIIYQTFARALRGNSEDQKYYLKVTPQGEGQMDLTNVSVCAALMLTDRRYLETYNGKNFNGLFIPVIKQSRKRSKSTGKGIKKQNKPQQRVIFPEYTNDVIDMFKNVIHSLDDPASIYKMVTIGEVRKTLAGHKTFEEHLELAKEHKLTTTKWEEYWEEHNLREQGYLKQPWWSFNYEDV